MCIDSELKVTIQNGTVRVSVAGLELQRLPLDSTHPLAREAHTIMYLASNAWKKERKVSNGEQMPLYSAHFHAKGK